MCSAFRFCLSVYLDLSPRGIVVPPQGGCVQATFLKNATRMPNVSGKDLLTGYILQFNHTPPPGWEGIVPLTVK
jgi:hypothetical protein